MDTLNRQASFHGIPAEEAFRVARSDYAKTHAARHGFFVFSGDYFTISWYSRSMVWSQSMMDKCWGQAASHAPHWTH